MVDIYKIDPHSFGYSSYIDRTAYAIYVWDTRQVIEEGNAKNESDKIQGTSAVDNHKPLNGKVPWQIQYELECKTFTEKEKQVDDFIWDIKLRCTKAIREGRALSTMISNELLRKLKRCKSSKPGLSQFIANVKTTVSTLMRITSL